MLNLCQKHFKNVLQFLVRWAVLVLILQFAFPEKFVLVVVRLFFLETRSKGEGTQKIFSAFDLLFLKNRLSF